MEVPAISCRWRQVASQPLISQSSRARRFAASVNAMQRDIADALDAGFTDYLTKPLDMQPSAGVVDKLLSD